MDRRMLKQLEEQAEPPVPVASEPLYVRDLSGKMRLNVNRTEQPTEPKPSAEELEKKAAEDDKKKAEKQATEDRKQGLLPTEPLTTRDRVLTAGVLELKAAVLEKAEAPRGP